MASSSFVLAAPKEPSPELVNAFDQPLGWGKHCKVVGGDGDEHCIDHSYAPSLGEQFPFPAGQLGSDFIDEQLKINTPESSQGQRQAKVLAGERAGFTLKGREDLLRELVITSRQISSVHHLNIQYISFVYIFTADFFDSSKSAPIVFLIC